MQIFLKENRLDYGGFYINLYMFDKEYILNISKKKLNSKSFDSSSKIAVPRVKDMCCPYKEY